MGEFMVVGPWRQAPLRAAAIGIEWFEAPAVLRWPLTFRQAGDVEGVPVSVLSRVAFVAVVPVMAALLSALPAAASECPVNTTITVSGSGVTVTGTGGADVICVTGDNNTVNAMDGDDTVVDLGANNVIDLGNGNDSADGSASSGGGSFYGGTGNDLIIGTPGDDTISGGDDNDSLVGGSGVDEVSGGSGSDSLQGEAGADNLFGESGTDTLTGGIGDDVLVGGDGGDSLDGGTGTNMCDYTAGETRTITCEYDDDAPVLSFSIAPTTVEVGTARQEFTVTGYATDATRVTGISVSCGGYQVSWYASPRPYAYSSDGVNTRSGLETYFTASGSGKRVDFSVPVGVAFGRPPGTFPCTSVALDLMGNERIGSSPVTLTVVRTGSNFDDTAPEVSFTVSPTTVDVGTARQEFTVTGRVSDPSGVKDVKIDCGASFIYWYIRNDEPPYAYSFDGSVTTDSLQGAFTVSPDGRTVNFSVPVGVAKGAVPQAVVCTNASTDKLGNHRIVNTGPTLTILRTGGVYDDAPPSVSYTISPSTVDVGSAAAQFTISGEAVDPTGIRWLNITCGASKFNWYSGSPGATWTTDGVTYVDDVEQWIDASADETQITFAVPVAVTFSRAPGTYVCRTMTQDKLGNSGTSDSGPILNVLRTPPGSPGAPTRLAYTPTSGRPTEGRLSWDGPESVGSPPLQDYQIDYSRDGVTWTTLREGRSTATSVRLVNLRAGSAYWFRVRADNGGNSLAGSSGAPWSQVLQVDTPNPIAPDAPTGLDVSSVTGSSARLAWTAPAYNGGATISDYTVELARNAGATWSPVPHSASNATSMKLTGLAPGTSYRVRVSAVNSAGSSGYLTGTLTTAATAPAAVRNLVATSIASTTLTLLWDVPATNGGAPIKDYQVEFSRNGNTYTAITHAESNATRFNVSGLRAGTRYWFRVAALNSVGIGTISAPITVTTLGNLPGAPTGLAISVSGGGASTRYTLSWRPPVISGTSPVRNYLVDYRRSNADGWTPVVKAVSANTSLALTGLAPRTRYQFRVVAVNDVGVSESSTVLSFTTR